MVEHRNRPGYTRVRTHLPNILVRVAAGAELGVDPLFLPTLVDEVRDYHEVHDRSKKAEEEREALRAQILQTLWQLPHLRGVEERDKKRVLDFIPEHEVSWNIPLLRESLGPLAGTVIKEEPALELLIPSRGLRTARGTILTLLDIRQAFVQSLMQKGISRVDAEKVLPLKRKTRIDEEALKSLEKEKHVKLPEGVRTVRIVNWRLTPYPLK